MKIYSQKWYKDKLGTCNSTISSHGCFLVCVSMLAGIEPPEANKLLTKNGGYSNGCLLLSGKASEILGVEYDGKTTKEPKDICIAETNYYKNKGIPQHFFIYHKGEMVDPLDQKPEWRGCSYPIISYRLFKLKSMEKKNQEFYDEKLKKQGWATLEDWVKAAREYRDERDKLDNKLEESQKTIEKMCDQYKTLIINQDKLNQAHDLELTRQKNSLTAEFNQKLNELQKEPEKQIKEEIVKNEIKKEEIPTEIKSWIDKIIDYIKSRL